MGIYTNNSKRPVFVAGRMVLSGQSIEMTTAVVEVAEPETSPEGFNPTALLAKTARDIDDALTGLDRKQLEVLHRLESQADKPRISVLDSLNAALLQQVG